MRGNPKQCADEIKARMEETKKLVKAAMKDEIKAAMKFAKSMSKGKYKSVQLARMGHPYATRNPRPPAPTELINRQTGKFLNSFKTDSNLNAINGNWRALLENSSPEAHYLISGTKTMIERPIDKAVSLIMEKRFRLAIQDAIRTGLKL